MSASASISVLFLVAAAAVVAACSSGATGTSSCVEPAPTRVKPAVEGRCDGSQKRCSTYSSKLRCDGQTGCTWSSTGEYCSGSARDCTHISSSSSCRAQDGCTWTGGDEGESAPSGAAPCAARASPAPTTTPACSGPPPSSVCVKCSQRLETRYPQACMGGVYGCKTGDQPEETCPSE